MQEGGPPTRARRAPLPQPPLRRGQLAGVHRDRSPVSFLPSWRCHDVCL